jgi:peptide/nickel transport system permease protein
MNAVIIIELVFGFQGLGIFIFSSIYSYDLNRLMGGVFVLGIATFIGMLLSDLVSTRIDPRIRQFR